MKRKTRITLVCLTALIASGLSSATSADRSGLLQTGKADTLSGNPGLTDTLRSNPGNERTDTLRTAVVTAAIDRNLNFTQTGLTRIDNRAFRKGFALFSSPDIVKTLQMLTGVAAGTELMSNLYVHGGDGSDNLFLLDGVPMYQVCHLGGLFSAFNTDIVENLNFYKSGFPARYGGRTSSVVDVTTADGSFDRYHGTVSIGLLDGRLQIGGPILKGKTSFNLAMRRSWMDLLLIPANAIVNKSAEENAYPSTPFEDEYLNKEKQWYTYAFADINARVTHRFNPGSVLTANFYWGYDDLVLKYELETTSTRDPHYLAANDSRLKFNWGNILGSVNWKKQFSDRLDLRVAGFYSGSRSHIRFNNLYRYRQEGMLQDGTDRMENSGDVNDYGVTADLNWLPGDRHQIRFGTAYIFHDYRPGYDISSSLSQNGSLIYEQAFQDIFYTTGHETALYAEDEIAVTPRLRLNVGLRYALYGTGEKLWHSLEPRAAVKYQLSDRISLKASYSEMSQYSHLVASTYLDLPTNCWLPSSSLIPPMRSRQVAGGIYTRLPAHLHLNLEGWWKTMDNLIEYKGMNAIFPRLNNWEEDFKTGIGKSYGLEADFGYETDRTTLNLFYTLSWSWRKFDDIYTEWYLDRNDNRHKITLMGTHRFSEKFELYAAWNYHTGNRITMPTQYIPGENGDGEYIYEQPNNVALPAYHRLDIGMNFHLKTRRGNESIWNLSIYNVYSRINPMFAYLQKENTYTPDGDLSNEHFVAYGYGLIPILPTISYTFRF